MSNKVFNKGDFVKYKVYNNSITFGIFEGIDLEPNYQYSKKFSLAAYYDSNKYTTTVNDNGIRDYGYKAVLEVATDTKPCEKTIDTLVEDTWWTLCTEDEKHNAIEVLASYGYEWNEELLAIVDMDSGEIVHKIIVPKIEYNGETIKPIADGLKKKLKDAVITKNKASNAYSSYHNGSYHYGQNPNYNYDYYDD